jgi:uncharacterized protein
MLTNRRACGIVEAEVSMRSTAATFSALRQEIDHIPVVDTHEHHVERTRTTDIMAFIAGGYFGHDLASAVGEQGLALMIDADRPLSERWPTFASAFGASRHTGYGRTVRYGLERVFGDDWSINQPLTLELLKRWQQRLPDYSQEEGFEEQMRDARVVARITDNWPSLASVAAGSASRLPGQHLAIGLPPFHTFRSRDHVTSLERAMGRSVTSLEEYVQVCAELFERWKEQGAVCLKDQAAYVRSVAYSLPTHAEAEAVFNQMLMNPRAGVEWTDAGNALSDYLMHRFMRLAREMNLPVQLHTGHMAGLYNDVAKANAAGLRSLLEIHKEVSFNLFHANWPYSGDILFLAKNYPNVTLNFCWTHQVDPLYAKSLMMQAVSALPTTKVHAVGSDVSGAEPHLTFAHVRLAKDVLASALSELVEMELLTSADAVETAKLWLYTNAREFFALPIDPLAP